MPRIDDAGGRLRALAVDVSGLDRFAGSVEGEAEANYVPQAADLMRVYAVGAHFGVGHAGPDVLAARLKYTECLQGAVDQLAGFANAAAIPVEAARTVAVRYRDTDALAASNASEVEQALAAATLTAQGAQHAAATGDVELGRRGE